MARFKKTILYTILLTSLPALSFSNEISCKEFFNPNALNNSEFLLEGRGAVTSTFWLEHINTLRNINKDKVWEYLKTARKKAGVKTEDRKSLLRTVRRGYLDDRGDRFIPNYFHLTQRGDLIVESQQLKLTSGARNEAAICLGDGGFAFNPGRVAEILRVKLKPTAKTLNLTFRMDGSARNSYYDLYLEYETRIRGLIQRTPELRKIAKQLGTDHVETELMSKEAFGHFLGADVLYVTEKYGQVNRHEYWVLNPEAIQEITRMR